VTDVGKINIPFTLDIVGGLRRAAAELNAAADSIEAGNVTVAIPEEGPAE
jgi:hypothetical protein